MSIGLKGALTATDVLAATALDVLTDAELRAAARSDFERRTAGIEYVSPIPPEQTARSVPAAGLGYLSDARAV